MAKRNIYIVVGLVLIVVVGLVTYGARKRTLTEEGYAYSDERSAESGGIVAQSLGMAMGSRKVANQDMPAAKMSDGAMPQTQSSEPTTRLVIKTGEISIVVKDVRASAGAVAAYATSHGGYIVSSNISQAGIAPSGTVTIRIPVAVFDAGFADLKALGEVQSENVSGEDVTEQYVDLTARLKNLQATESQLLEIMKRAVKISDVLEVQNQLTQVRSNIESFQGRIKYLKDSAAMSSLTVYLSTDPSQLPVVHEPTDAWKPLAIAKEALRSLLNVAKSGASLIIWVVIFIPVWAAIVLVVWGITKIVKRIWKRTNPHVTL